MLSKAAQKMDRTKVAQAHFRIDPESKEIIDVTDESPASLKRKRSRLNDSRVARERLRLRRTIKKTKKILGDTVDSKLSESAYSKLNRSNVTTVKQTRALLNERKETKALRQQLRDIQAVNDALVTKIKQLTESRQHPEILDFSKFMGGAADISQIHAKPSNADMTTISAFLSKS